MQITIDPGLSFYQAFRKASDIFENSSTHYLEFDFNGINITVYRGSIYNDIALIYDLKCQIRRMKGE